MFDAAQNKVRALSHKLSANKKVEYPSKTTINLVEIAQEKSASKTQRAVMVLVVALLALVFVKFGVIDLLVEANDETAKVSSLQSELTVLQQQNTDYVKIKEQLDKYSAPGMTDEAQTYTLNFADPEKSEDGSTVRHSANINFTASSYAAAKDLISKLVDGKYSSLVTDLSISAGDAGTGSGTASGAVNIVYYETV